MNEWMNEEQYEYMIESFSEKQAKIIMNSQQGIDKWLIS